MGVSKKKRRRTEAPPSLGRKRPRKQTARPGAALLQCKTYGTLRLCASDFSQRSIRIFGGQRCYSRVASRHVPSLGIEETSRPAHEGGASLVWLDCAIALKRAPAGKQRLSARMKRQSKADIGQCESKPITGAQSDAVALTEQVVSPMLAGRRIG